jgi:hypothetical protein
MAFCTIVEWSTDVDLGRLTALGESDGTHTELPPGCLSRLVGALETGACVIEVWQSGEDARRLREESAPQASASALPPPSRVAGCEAQLFQSR